MRTRLLSALAILCGADVACAQMAPTYPTNGYYQGYGPGYPTAPANNGYYGTNPYMRPSGYGQYYQGNTGYPGMYQNPSYTNRYPNYYYYANGYPRAAAPAMLTAQTKQPEAIAAPATTPAAPPVVYQPIEVLPARDPVGPVDPTGWDGKKKAWFGLDYSMMWIRPERTPPLVTIGSQADAVPGAIGQPGTVVLFGNNNVDFGMFNGVRAEGGFYLDSSNRFSIDAAGEFEFQNQIKFAKASDAAGNPVIGRPFFNVVSGNEAVDQVSNALSGFSGSTSVDAKSAFYGAELNARYHWNEDKCLHWDALVGFRYAHLNESLTMQDQITPTTGALVFEGAGVVAPDTVSDLDDFRTSNNFYGMQLGGSVTWESAWFFVDGFAKIGLGANDQRVDINGTTTLLTPAGSTTVPGGILALPTNIGSFSRTTFGAIPEFGLNLGVMVCPHVQLTAGYSFLLWNEVVRPGNQIDRNVNPTLIPLSATFGTVPPVSPNRPQFAFSEEVFWAQFLNVGVNIRY